MDGIGELARMFTKRPEQRDGSATATVRRVDDDGTVWCEIAGGAGEFPCDATLADVAAGDAVTVTIGDGSATVTGSTSAPSISAARASEMLAPIAESAATASSMAANAKASAESAEKSAEEALESAATANRAAESAVEDAATAKGAAEGAVADAAVAKESADRASRYSSAALDQLGIVQDVVGVLDWASAHGGFVETSDAEIAEGKVYFAYDAQSGDYAPVVEPEAAQLASYYELDMSGEREAMNDFIMAHLAVTSRGLWVLPNGIGSASNAQYANGYKLLLSNDGSYVYDNDGLLVTKLGENIDFSSTRPQRIGNDTAYVEFYDSDSDGVPDAIRISGTNINTAISSVQSTLNTKADSSTVSTLTERVATAEQDVSGFKQTVAETYATKSEVDDSLSAMGYEVEVSATSTDITEETPTVTLAATVRKDGAELTATDILRIGCVKWYRVDTGALVGTGLSCTVSAQARYTARLEG